MHSDYDVNTHVDWTTQQSDWWLLMTDQYTSLVSGEYPTGVDVFVFQGEKGRSLPGQKGDEVQAFRAEILFFSGHAPL